MGSRCFAFSKIFRAVRRTGTGKGENATGGSGWRPWLDLEHVTCYNNTNHWSAITDGNETYQCTSDVYISTPRAALQFTADPGELVGLHAKPEYAQELTLWRGRMVAQFEAKGVALNGSRRQIADAQIYYVRTEFSGHNRPGPPGSEVCPTFP